MKNIKFSRLFAAMMVVACLVFVGCQNQSEEEGSIYGTWVASEYELYVISEDSFSAYWGAETLGYKGDNLTVVEESGDSGKIYVKYTRAMNPDFSYSEDAPDVGKWYAISYKNLTKDSIAIAGAYKKDGKTSCDTLAEAKKEFTSDNGYFDNYSECKKQ